MGNMSDEMKKILNKWHDSESAPAQQDAPKQTYRSEIHNIVKDNPGITTPQVLQAMQAKGFAQTYSSVSSQMTTMFHEFMLRREEGPANKTTGRKTYMYYYVPPLESMKLKAEHLRKKAQAQARAERARQIRAEKLKARAATLQGHQEPQEQLALPFDPVEKLPEPAAAPDLKAMSAMDILNAINFTQAKALYKELKEAFGG